MATSATHRAASSPTRLPAAAPTCTELVSGLVETWAQHRSALICSLAATALATTGLLALIVTGA